MKLIGRRREIFSSFVKKFAYHAIVLEDLKIGDEYDGFLFLSDAAGNPPVLRPHRHRELELNLVVRGAITYVVGRRRFTFAEGTLLWMFPRQEHQLVDRTANSQYYVAVFKPELIREACRTEKYGALLREEHPAGDVVHTELDTRSYGLLKVEMDAIAEEGLDTETLTREAGFGVSPDFAFRHHDPDWLNAGLRHLLLFAWRHQHDRSRTGNDATLHPAITRALALLGTPDEPAGIGELARRCGMSPSHFSRTFHRQVGVTLTRYRNSVRLRRFWECYRQQRDFPNLLGAVYDAGFGSYAQFFRVFREAYRDGPREWLARQRMG